MTEFRVTPELTELAAEAKRAGLGNGVDFYIRGIPFSGQLGTDLIGLSYDGQSFTVEHREASRTKEILRTTVFGQARELFLTKAEEVAARYAPRREHRPDPTPTKPVRSGGAGTAVLAGVFGIVFGILVIPAVVVVIALAIAAGSYDSGGKGKGGRWFESRPQRVSFGIGVVIGLIGLAAIAVAWAGTG